MLTTRRLRGLALLPVAGLMTALLTTVGTAPASAADECLSEVLTGETLPGVGGATCDDVVAPETTLTRVQPEPRTADRWLQVPHVTFTFGGRHTDADADPIAFECQFYATISAPAAWESCTSPQTYDKLAETAAVPYTFRVRAVDSGDMARDPKSCASLFCTPATTDVEDVDSTPATTQVSVDTVAPSSSARINGLFDEENPRWPMIRAKRVQVVLSASGTQDRSPVDFDCTLNGKPVDCAKGTTDLTRLTPGNKRFSARAKDAAGNVDASPATLQFSVPRNLTAKKGSAWKRVREGGYFAGDFLQTTRPGAVVSFPARNVRELRLIAPRGPGLGKVQVKIGQGAWRTVNLRGGSYERFHVYEVRDQFEPLVSGRIQVRAKKASRNQYVRIDAVLAH